MDMNRQANDLSHDRQASMTAEGQEGRVTLLSDSASLFSEAQRLAHVGIWSWDVTSGAKTWSEEVFRIFEHDPQSPPLRNEEFQRLLSGEDWTAFEAAIDRAVTAGVPYAIDAELLLSSGTRKWVVLRGRAVRDADGRIVGLHGTVQDITERKRTETELRRLNDTLEARVAERTRELSELNRVLQASEARFRSLAAFSPIGIFLNDAGGKCIYANERCQEIFGMSEEQLLGEGWSTGLHPEDRARVFGRWAQARAAGAELADEFRVLRPDAGVRHVRTRVRPVVVGGRAPSGFVGCVEDVTARKLAEDALVAARADAERANAAKTRFVAAASHDLRQPLSALGLYVGTLEQKLGSDFGPLLGGMQACVASLGELLTDLLDLCKLEAGAMIPQVSHFAVDELIAKVLAAHAPGAQQSRLDLRFRACGLTARTDPVLYGRILGNLVSNAVRYTPRGGVLIGCRRRDGGCWIEVWDTGSGIPEDMLGEVFEEFRQLHGGEPARGSGLGLAIVSRIAQLLGLRLRVRSRVGKGSLFAIELPSVAVREGAAEFSVASGGQARGLATPLGDRHGVPAARR